MKEIWRDDGVRAQLASSSVDMMAPGPLNYGEHPSAAAPRFVQVGQGRRLALAAAFCVGESVLDLGASEGDLERFLRTTHYTAVDQIEQAEPHSKVIQADAVKFIHQCGNDAFDTVVALEHIEHLDPGMQFGFVADCCRVARRRVLISTPDPNALQYYPRTEHFVGRHNPWHTREIDEWKLRAYVHQAWPGVKHIQTLHSFLTADDESVWGETQPPSGYLLVIDL